MSQTKQTGFSLLEVLVAFSIFAVSLGIIFQIYSKGAKSAILANDYADAIIIAQSQLANIGVETQLDNGVYENNYEKFHWVTRAQSIIDDDYDFETRHKIIKSDIEIEVFWKSQGRTHSVKLSTLKLFHSS